MFDAIFSMKPDESGTFSAPGRGTLLRCGHPSQFASIESEDELDDEEEEDAASPPFEEMVSFAGERHNTFQSSPSKAFSTPPPKERQQMTLDDDPRRTTGEGFFVSSFVRLFKPQQVENSASSSSYGRRSAQSKQKKNEMNELALMKVTVDDRWRNTLKWFVVGNRQGKRALFFPYPDCFSDSGALNRIFQFEITLKSLPSPYEPQLIPPLTYLGQLRKFL